MSDTSFKEYYNNYIIAAKAKAKMRKSEDSAAKSLKEKINNDIKNHELDISLSACFISDSFRDKFVLNFIGQCPFDFINTISKKYILKVVMYEVYDNETEVHLVIPNEE